ncbi:hypothetical protein cyc_04627 [Cyclospora cayetanensis]|uniref:Uncharacterized protein n=1 Tax=Cyclospora cayetanensis TaxID=88456 RepID=A0A1D3CTZ0_9EIME|nr:hypothetical protein cyc_04627 [Cyclospora cayetanensis]
MRANGGSAEGRNFLNASLAAGPSGRASASGSILYSHPPARNSRSRRLSTGCGWYEYGLYDVAVELTKVPLKAYELEYRERTLFSSKQLEPVELPRNQPKPVVLKFKAKPKACAPPHPSTVRVSYEPAVAPLVQPEVPALHTQSLPKKLEKGETVPPPLEKAEKKESSHNLTKVARKDKSEKHSKEKHERHDKEKKKKVMSQPPRLGASRTCFLSCTASLWCGGVAIDQKAYSAEECNWKASAFVIYKAKNCEY